jgi:hypothetical protein
MDFVYHTFVPVGPSRIGTVKPLSACLYKMLILMLYNFNSINRPNLMGARRSCGQLKVLLPHIDKTRYLHVQHMWDQYDREDDDFDSILLNPGWEIRPAIVISESGCPWVVTCRNHGGGSKFQVLYPPCYPDHHLSAKCTDQL